MIVEPCQGGLGARVRDCQITGLTDENLRALRLALLVHRVLIFRDQSLSAAELMRFGRTWGRLRPHPYARARGLINPIAMAGGDGDRGPGDSYHIDHHWMPTVPDVGILHALAVPPDGGNTEWIDVQRVYEHMEEDTRDRLRGLSTWTDLGKGFRQSAIDAYGLEDGARFADQMPGAAHPLLTRHPVTNRTGVLLSEALTRRVLGISPATSARILADLRSRFHAEIPLVCTWRPNTVVIWDQHATAHRVRPHSGGRRALRRVTAGDTSPAPVDAT